MIFIKTVLYAMLCWMKYREVGFQLYKPPRIFYENSTFQQIKARYQMDE